MRALVLRFDAPLLSFGGVMVDQHGVIDRFPRQAMLTGLLANALGWEHGDFDKLEALQARLLFAARWDVAPRRIVDYQTVDLGQPKMALPGWTTRGEPEHREGGEARFGTHVRLRHYWVDGLMTVVVALEGDGSPALEELVEALRRPARPLFLGRKSCLPSRPLLDPKTPILEGENLLEILKNVPRWNRWGEEVDASPLEACWPVELGGGEVRRVYDLRSWRDQLPAGSRLRREGLLCPDGNHVFPT